jgi:hypothetical protein
MERKKRRISKGMAWSLVGAVLLVGVLVYAIMCCFSSQRQMRNSVVVVEGNVWYTVGTSADKMIFFSEIAPDSTFAIPSATLSPLLLTPHLTSGFWTNRFALLPSCSGRVVTAMPQGTANKGTLPADANTMVQKTLMKLVVQEKQLKREIKETDYYIKVHGMQDEGYTAVVAYAHKLKTQLTEVQKVGKRLAALRKEKLLRVLRHTRYAVHFDGKTLSAKCLREDLQWGLCLLQTTDSETPWRASTISVLPWGMSATDEVRVASVPGLGLEPLDTVKNNAAVWVANVEADANLRMHTALGQPGSPVFSAWGRFMGMYNGRGIVPRHIIAKLLWNEK